ncbi:MAG TPA: ABC transporter ATP-binding protein [Solirubrobacteraceae bacterium]|jgi:oligopeptide/dipeptide ABC transporter ATP-binding protein
MAGAGSGGAGTDAVAGESAPLLQARALVKRFAVTGARLPAMRRGRAAALTALDGVSLAIGAGEAIGVVGESGSGKSTLAKCLVALLRPEAGTVSYSGADVAGLRGPDLARLRRDVQLIFQNPYASLNPLIDVGEAVAEPAWVHRLIERRVRRAHAAELLQSVGLVPALAHRRPHELSGGQRQRVAIARALAVRPRLLIADEALSALDVSVQAQVLELLRELRAQRGIGILFISHQLSVVARIADTVLIMYLGRIVESGPTARVFSEPAHPYTAGLLAAQPGRHRSGRRRAPALKGEIPSPLAIPSGCRFRTRCPRAEAICASVDPPRVQSGPGHAAWCHFAGEQA